MTSSPSAASSSPATGDLTTRLERALDHAAGLRDGEVATYIPELAGVDGEFFAVAACTPDGAVLQAL